MMVKTQFSIEEPKKIECTLKITMTMKEWEELNSQLKEAYPSWNLSSAIDCILRVATKEFYDENQDCG